MAARSPRRSQRHDPHCRGVLLLGLEASEDALARELRASPRRMPSARASRSAARSSARRRPPGSPGRCADDAVVADVAARYARLVALWRARAHAARGRADLASSPGNQGHRMSAPTRIGFIGIGMMGHGMAKNLLAKGYPLTFKANRNRARARRPARRRRARRRQTNAEVARGSRHRLHLRHRLAAGRGDRVRARAACSRGARNGLIVVDTSTAEPASTEQHARRLRAPRARASSTRRSRARRRRPRRGASTPWSAPSRPTSRRSSRCCRPSARTSSTSARRAPATCSSWSTTCWRCRRRRRSPRRSRSPPRAGWRSTKLFEVVSAGGVNSGIFQMMVGKMLQGDLAGLKFAIANAQKDLRYYTHLAESLPVPELHGRGGAPELRAGRQPRLRRQVHRLAVRGAGADRQGPHRSAAVNAASPTRTGD